MNSPAASGGGSAGQRRWRLPADVSGFVGRSSELARLASLLDSARLVTVAGPGGVGKTRLALRAAADAAGDGSCLVELSGLSDPELLPDTVALRLVSVGQQDDTQAVISVPTPLGMGVLQASQFVSVPQASRASISVTKTQ